MFLRKCSGEAQRYFNKTEKPRTKIQDDEPSVSLTYWSIICRNNLSHAESVFSKGYCTRELGQLGFLGSGREDSLQLHASQFYAVISSSLSRGKNDRTKCSFQSSSSATAYVLSRGWRDECGRERRRKEMTRFLIVVDRQ